VRRQSSDHFDFEGGLNLIESPLSVIPGQCTGALNYEMGFDGGYRRIGGYKGYSGISTDDEDYWILQYGALARQVLSRSIGDVIDGDPSTASGEYLTSTEEGGHGYNEVSSNEEFDNADWTIDGTTLSFIDGDIAATSNHPQLSKLTEAVDATDDFHRFDNAVSTDWTTNEGDVVYCSFYMKAGSRSSVQVQLNGTDVFVGGQAPGITVNGNTGSVVLHNAGVAAYPVLHRGVEDMGDGVYRGWFYTVMADGTNTDCGVRVYMMDGSDAFYQGDGSHVYFGGLMVVRLPPQTPHNLYNGRDLTQWFASGVTLTSNDKAFSTASSVSEFIHKLTDSGDTGSGRVHGIKSETSSSSTIRPIKVKAGDRLYVEWFAEYTSGQIEIQALVSSGMSVNTFGKNQFLYFYADIKNGVQVATNNSEAIDQVVITSLGGGGTTWKIQFITVPAVQDDEFSFWFLNAIDDSSGVPENFTTYSHTSLYSHLTSFWAVAYSSDIDYFRGHEIQFGYVRNLTGENNYVNSGDLILHQVTGDYTATDDLDIAAVKTAESKSASSINGETDATKDAAYTALANANAPTGADAPTGSGAIRGVWMHEGIVYAFRDNVGATQCDMWKATGSGWVQITLNDVVHFDAGDGTEPSEGDTVTVTAGSKSAPIKRIVKTSGTWGVDAAGYLVLGTVTNGPIANNDELLVSASRIADADGASAVPTLAAGGRYEFRSHNFYGHTDQYRMYGVDGVNLAFEYDADDGVFTQIETGMTTDTPNHLAVHNGHLFLSFAGGSVQLSGDGNPLSFTVITGASEIGVGDEISGFNEEVGNSLFIFTRDSTYVLQGNTRANFDLDDFNVNAGAHEWSLQRIGLGCYLDDRGFTTLLQTQRSGSVNFQENTISELVQPLIKELIQSTTVRCSHLLRNQNIYRCYFEDGRVVSIGFDGHRASGHMPLEYPFVANVACSEEDANGAERIFVGADDGFVYELETGTSFNNDPIPYFMRTVLYHSKTPGRFKKYCQARLDATLSGALTLNGQIEYDFHNDDFNLADELDFSTDEAGGYWDDFTWDAFVWDKPTSGIPQVKLEGEGVNVAVYLRGNSDQDDVHTLRGITLQWLPRRDDRRN
jgi:hypothetical protein